MCSKELDEQYAVDIVFVLYLIVLHVNVSFANALHFLPDVVYTTKYPKQFLIVIHFLLKMSADYYVSQCFQLCLSRCM